MDENNNEVQYPENPVSTYQVVDKILAEQVAGTYSVYFKKLSSKDTDTIAEEVSKKVDYTLIPNAPQVPNKDECYELKEIGIQKDSEGNPIYETEIDPETGETIQKTIPIYARTQLKQFDPIAFTGISKDNLDGVELNVTWDSIEDAPSMPAGVTKTIVNGKEKYPTFHQSAFNGQTIYANITDAPTLPQGVNTRSFNASAFTGKVEYSNINDAPGLPDAAYNIEINEETGEEIRTVKPFSTAAFNDNNTISLEYNDILHAPGLPREAIENITTDETTGEVLEYSIKDFNPIAFTGVTDISNILEQTINIIDLTQYRSDIETEYGFLATDSVNNDSNYYKLAHLGVSDRDTSIYILGYKKFKRTDSDNIEHSLHNDLIKAIQDFRSNKHTPLYLASEELIFEVTDIRTQSTDTELFLQLSLVPVIYSNYYTIRQQLATYTNNNVSSEKERIVAFAEEQIKDFSYDYNTHILIIDIQNDIIYYNNKNLLNLYNLNNSQQVIEESIIDFDTFFFPNNNELSTQLAQFGTTTDFIMNINEAINKQSTDVTLRMAVESFLDFANNPYILYFNNNTHNKMQITNTIKVPNQYIIFETVNQNITNFIPYIQSTMTAEIAEQQLNQITITPQYRIFIFDLINNVAYCKIDTNRVSYADILNAPALPSGVNTNAFDPIAFTGIE